MITKSPIKIGAYIALYVNTGFYLQVQIWKMTRYARSTGIKGQNKMVHQSTPWTSLKPTKKKGQTSTGLQNKSKNIQKTKKTQNLKHTKEEPLVLPSVAPRKPVSTDGIAALIEHLPVDCKKSQAKTKVKTNVRAKLDKLKTDMVKSGKELSAEEISEVDKAATKADRSEQRRLKRAEQRDTNKVYSLQDFIM